MKKIRFTKPFPYAGKQMKPGDTVMVVPSVARLMVAIGKAAYAEEKGAQKGKSRSKTAHKSQKSPQKQHSAQENGANSGAPADAGDSNPAPATDTTDQTQQ
jgi:uncharacterized phosphosugar-binding protein